MPAGGGGEFSTVKFYYSSGAGVSGPRAEPGNPQKLTFVANVIRRHPDAELGFRKFGEVMMPLYPSTTTGSRGC